MRREKNPFKMKILVSIMIILLMFHKTFSHVDLLQIPSLKTYLRQHPIPTVQISNLNLTNIHFRRAEYSHVAYATASDAVNITISGIDITVGSDFIFALERFPAISQTGYIEATVTNAQLDIVIEPKVPIERTSVEPPNFVAHFAETSHRGREIKSGVDMGNFRSKFDHWTDGGHVVTTYLSIDKLKLKCSDSFLCFVINPILGMKSAVIRDTVITTITPKLQSALQDAIDKIDSSIVMLFYDQIGQQYGNHKEEQRSKYDPSSSLAPAIATIEHPQVLGEIVTPEVLQMLSNGQSIDNALASQALGMIQGYMMENNLQLSDLIKLANNDEVDRYVRQLFPKDADNGQSTVAPPQHEKTQTHDQHRHRMGSLQYRGVTPRYIYRPPAVPRPPNLPMPGRGTGRGLGATLDGRTSILLNRGGRLGSFHPLETNRKVKAAVSDELINHIATKELRVMEAQRSLKQAEPALHKQHKEEGRPFQFEDNDDNTVVDRNAYLLYAAIEHGDLDFSETIRPITDKPTPPVWPKIEHRSASESSFWDTPHLISSWTQNWS